MSGQVTTKPTVLQSLVGRLGRTVVAAERTRAALHLVDWLGVARLAANTEVGRRFACDSATSGECRMLGGPRGAWWEALQQNAAVGSLLEMDDLHRTSILHPGPVIIPAAVAVAELQDADGARLLAALVRGYEATIRIGRALGARHYAYFHNTSTAGAFGAAAAAADLLRLDAGSTVWALANAGTRTGGLWQMRHEACESKSLHNAQAAQAGVQAALLAARGVRGPASLLEGPQGLFAALAPGADPHATLADPDDPWLINEVSFKPWPACRHVHPAIDAALALRAALGDDFAHIERVTVATYRSALDFCDRPHPVTEADARFSLQHAVAVCLAAGSPTLAHFTPAGIADPRFTALRAQVTCVESTALSARFPAHYGALLTLTLRDGRVLRQEQDDALGDPELPLSRTAIRDKAARLLDAAGLDDPEALIDATFALADGGRVRDWTAAWR